MQQESKGIMPKQSVRNHRAADLIRQGVESLGVRGLARAVGVSPGIITRYVQGDVGEPSQATLEKLADHFGVRLQYLRGGAVKPLDRILEAVRKQGYTRTTFNEKMVEQRPNPEEGSIQDYWRFFIDFDEALPEGDLLYLCRVFEINQYWVETGRKPTVLGAGGFVGEESPPKLKVVEGVAVIPGGASNGGDIVIQAVTCAKCGSVLKRADRPEEPYNISYWPCKKCCK